MKGFVFGMVAALLVCCAAVADEPVGPYLQSISVNVSAGGAQGSGTIVLVEVEGNRTTWILTAYHVISGLRDVQTVIAPGGEEKKQIRYRDATIVQEQVEGGRAVGEYKFDAKVVNADPRRDIALLRVRKDEFTSAGARFYLDDEIPVPGTELLHCGAPGGKELGGTCSLTSGIVSRLGVRIPDFGGSSEHGIFDQTSCPSLGGSSGGMVALKEDGRWVGMITLGIRGADSFCWVVPVRSVRAWAEEAGVLWLVDPAVKRPTQDDLEKIPLELNPPGFVRASGSGPTPVVERQVHEP